MFEFRMLRDASQCVRADVAFADVPVTIDARVVGSARIVEMDGAHVFESSQFFELFESALRAIFFANVVTGSEGVCRVEANAERKLRTNAHDLVEMFEAVTDAVALSRSVFEQDAKRPELQSLARDLQTRAHSAMPSASHAPRALPGWTTR